MVISQGRMVVCTAAKAFLKLLNGKSFPQSSDFKYLGSLLRAVLADIRARLRSGWFTLRSAAKFFHSAAASDKVKMKVFQTLIQTVFLYACQSWVLGDKERRILQGCYTRMLRFAKNIPYIEHPSLERIYGAIPSVLATIAQYRLHMLGTTFLNGQECPQPLIPVMKWMLMQIPVTTTMTVRVREQRFDYAAQLLRDVRCLTKQPRMHANEVLARLANYAEWHRTVVSKVHSSTFYKVAPSANLPSVLEPIIPFQSPPPAVVRRRARLERREGDDENLAPGTVERAATPARRRTRTTRVPILLSPPGARYRTRSRSAATGAANLQSDL